MDPTVTWPLGLTTEQLVTYGIFCLMGILTLIVGVLIVTLAFIRRPR